jgi:hypothetical protein
MKIFPQKLKWPMRIGHDPQKKLPASRLIHAALSSSSCLNEFILDVVSILPLLSPPTNGA